MRSVTVQTSAAPERRVAVDRLRSVSVTLGLRSESADNQPCYCAPGETRTPNLLIRRPRRRVRRDALRADLSVDQAGRHRPDPAASASILSDWLPDWLPRRRVRRSRPSSLRNVRARVKPDLRSACGRSMWRAGDACCGPGQRSKRLIRPHDTPPAVRVGGRTSPARLWWSNDRVEEQGRGCVRRSDQGSRAEPRSWR